LAAKYKKERAFCGKRGWGWGDKVVTSFSRILFGACFRRFKRQLGIEGGGSFCSNVVTLSG
jgi:hypothetical protein